MAQPDDVDQLAERLVETVRFFAENGHCPATGGNFSLRSGDRVLSSGDGGGIPRGVPIGVVAKGVDGSWRVKLFSDRGAIDYVRVMLFEDFGQLANAEALNAPPLAALDTAPPPMADQAAAIGDAQARRQAAEEAARRANQAAAAAPPAATTPPVPASTQPERPA